MQYPTLDVEELKSMFSEARSSRESGIIFVSNKENFGQALEKSGYETYFKDRFGSSFGHCTIEGDRLIADNLAGKIIEVVGGDG
jgi:hypothetical protein